MARFVAFLLASVTLAHARVDTRLTSGALSLGSGDGAETCANLNNKGEYFSVTVSVGTPMEGTEQQTFELVADTGSDSVIVPSCICVERHYCTLSKKCFTGHNHSSSFAVKEKKIKGTNKSAPLGMALAFGSGVIVTVVSSDVVHVGGTQAKLDNGLLLMVDSRMLQIQSEFQGILGLGPPDFSDPNSKEEVLDNMANVQVKGKAEDGKTDAGASGTPAMQVAPATETNKNPHDEKEAKEQQKYKSQLFLQHAGVERYSLCFNDGGKPGAMRMNVAKFEKPLPTIGTFHWGLGLHGISVGDDKAEAFSCKDDDINATAGQKTPCGIIPDSGTTLLMGPEKHITKMYSGLCDKWDRCKKAQEEPSVKKANTSKADLFQELLQNCSQWKTEENGIDEVPSVFFNVGEGETTQKLELSAWSYIVETSQEIMEYHKRYLFGVIPVKVPKPTGKWEKVCMAQFGVTDYITKENGPVWIMGHPLFYQFNVGYSLGVNADPKSRVRGEKGHMEMAFSKEKCGSCDTKTSLLSEEQSTDQKRARPMRTVNDIPRVRHYDSNLRL